MRVVSRSERVALAAGGGVLAAVALFVLFVRGPGFGFGMGGSPGAFGCPVTLKMRTDGFFANGTKVSREHAVEAATTCGACNLKIAGDVKSGDAEGFRAELAAAGVAVHEL